MADINTFEQLTLIVSRRARPAVEAPNLLETVLARAANPFSQTDWSMPRARVQPTHTIAAARPFFYDEGKPHHQDTWPTPPRRRVGMTFDPPALLQSTLEPPLVVMPFRQTEWPVVLKVRRPTDTIALGRPFFYDEGKPQHQDAWPVPAPWRRPITFEPPNLLHGTLTPAAVQAPFQQSEWLTPAALRRATERGWTQTGLVIAIETVPMPTFEWPIPRRRSYTAPADHVNVTLTTLAPVPPFGLQRDWPLPVLKTRMALSWTQPRPSYYEEPVAPTVSRGFVTVTDAAVTDVTFDVS